MYYFLEKGFVAIMALPFHFDTHVLCVKVIEDVITCAVFFIQLE